MPVRRPQVDRVHLAQERQRVRRRRAPRPWPGTRGCPWAGSRRRIRGRDAGRRCRSARRAPRASASTVTSRAGRLAHLGHRVDERDLGRQERVRGDLDQFGGREVGDEQRDPGLQLTARRPARSIASAGADVTPNTSRSGCSVSCTRVAPRAGTPGSRRARPPSPAGASWPSAVRPARRRCRPARWTCRPPGRAGSGAGASASIQRLDVGQVRRVARRAAAGCRRRRSARRRTRPPPRRRW